MPADGSPGSRSLDSALHTLQKVTWRSGSSSGGLSTGSWKQPAFNTGASHSLRCSAAELSHRSHSSPALLAAMGPRHVRERIITGACNKRLHLEDGRPFDRRRVLQSPPRAHTADAHFLRRHTLLRPTMTPRPLASLPDGVEEGRRAAAERYKLHGKRHSEAAFAPTKVDHEGAYWRPHTADGPGAAGSPQSPGSPGHRGSSEGLVGYFFQTSSDGKRMQLEQLPVHDSRSLAGGAFNIHMPPGYQPVASGFSPPPAQMFDATVEQIDFLATRSMSMRKVVPHMDRQLGRSRGLKSLSPHSLHATVQLRPLTAEAATLRPRRTQAGVAGITYLRDAGPPGF